MQNQQEFYDTPEYRPPGERTNNTDPREQPPQQEYTDRSYEEGYSGLDERDPWAHEGEKLRPESKSQRSMGGLLAFVVLLCAVFIAGSLFGVILSWLSWLLVVVLVLAGLGALATNWRVVTIPMPTRTFQVMERARLVINNGAGVVSIRRGEEGVVSVAVIKRASGLGIDPERMQIRYDQYGDVLNISTQMAWNFLQFGLRAVDFEITVPANCNVQLDNGSGRVAVQGTSGGVRVRTGSGSIQAHDLQGQIAMKTGSSRIEASNLRGEVTAQTGSGRIEVREAALTGNSLLKTGSSSITFDGSLDPRGSYRLETGSGGINVALPAGSAFSLKAKTGSGGVMNEFGGNEVGSGPRAQLKLKTGSGGIRIHKSSAD